MRKIIIDTDPGVDDAFAIIAALLYEDFEVLGICSVAGNKGIDNTTNNSLRIAKLTNSDVKVYRGAKYPLGEEKNEDVSVAAHGKEGLGNTDLPFDTTNLQQQSAVDFIVSMANKYPKELEIISLGPMTNLALAINKDRKAMENIKAIYSMGGGVHRGNVTPVAEFNYWFDPEAVEITYSIGNKVPIYMVGLDVTHKVIFDVNDLYFIKKECGKLGEVLFDMSSNYIDVYWDAYKYMGCVIHDLLAVFCAIDDGEVFKADSIMKRNLRISKDGITKGQTVVDLLDKCNLEKNAYIVMDVDEKKCKNMFIELLIGEKHKLYVKHILK